jgi:hypothetical protein
MKNTALELRVTAYARTRVLTQECSDSMIIFCLSSRELTAEQVKAEMPAIRAALPQL